MGWVLTYVFISMHTVSMTSRAACIEQMRAIGPLSHPACANSKTGEAWELRSGASEPVQVQRVK